MDEQIDVKNRQRDLARIQQVLSTPDGEVLLNELSEIWDAPGLMGDTPEKTAYNVALRDAYKFLLELKDGDFTR